MVPKIVSRRAAERRGYTVLNIAVEVPNNKIDAVLEKIRCGCEISFVAKHKNRSLNANAYMWVLCDQIAEIIQSTKEEVYRQAVMNVGVFAPICVKEVAYSHTKRVWESRGVGYILQDVARRSGWVLCNAYIGSSEYSSKEMSRLINELAQEAENVGIDTISSKEREELILKWRKNDFETGAN